MLKFNQSATFYIKDNYIIIKNSCIEYIIKLKFIKKLYNFLVFAEENIFISQKDIENFKINTSIIKFLKKNFFLVNANTNSNIESICFDKLTGNPSTGYVNLNQKQIEKIYSNLNKELEKLLGNNFHIWKTKINKLNFVINENNYNQVKSTRLTKKSEQYNINTTLSIIKFIFSIRGKDTSNEINQTFFNFGSGGGFNSIFPILITKENQTIIYDKYKGTFLYKDTPGIYKEYIDKCLIGPNKEILNFSSYNYFLLLFSHNQKVSEKYGNKSYKLILLEGGQISFMFRQLYGNLNMPYLEVQGYYDEAIYNLMKNYDIINIKKNLLLHTICLSN